VRTQITDKRGANAYGLIKAAEKPGFTAKGVKGNRESLFSEFPLPAIALVIIDQKLLHPITGVIKYWITCWKRSNGFAHTLRTT
jgi:ABC-type bacteriocin/lantibiotic exporter with double-glycine peptidase domain